MLLMPVWIIAAVGAGDLKPLLPSVPAVVVNPLGTAWQVSQVVDVGKCALAPTGAVGGITTILGKP